LKSQIDVHFLTQCILDVVVRRICQRAPIERLIPHLLKFNFEGPDCECGKDEHKKLQHYIQCLFCEDNVHPECCHEFVDKPLNEIFRMHLQKHANVVRGDNTYRTPQQVQRLQPFWTICSFCARHDMFVHGVCCPANVDDNSTDAPPSIICRQSKEPIFVLHSCFQCRKPVHPACCVYIPVDQENSPHLLWKHWCDLPLCVVCAAERIQEEPRFALIRNWSCSSYPRQGDTVLEHPFPISTGDWLKAIKNALKSSDATTLLHSRLSRWLPKKTLITSKQRKHLRNPTAFKRIDDFRIHLPNLRLHATPGFSGAESFLSRITTDDVQGLRSYSEGIISPNTIDFSQQFFISWYQLQNKPVPVVALSSPHISTR